MTIIMLKEFATYQGFCELNKQWLYEHNGKTYAIDKQGVHKLS